VPKWTEFAQAIRQQLAAPLRLEVPRDARKAFGLRLSPRCPLATGKCRNEEAELIQTTGPRGHLAACHYRDQLAMP
jgi:ABC-type antimicrobial peptide transport system ATPase subunit